MLGICMMNFLIEIDNMDVREFSWEVRNEIVNGKKILLRLRLNWDIR